ncbi:hypothetical protein Hanom_Chr00s000673g01654881 [Helianthus anomalus]
MMPTFCSKLQPKMPTTIMPIFSWVNNLIVNTIKHLYTFLYFTKKSHSNYFWYISPSNL